MWHHFERHFVVFWAAFCIKPVQAHDSDVPHLHPHPPHSTYEVVNAFKEHAVKEFVPQVVSELHQTTPADHNEGNPFLKSECDDSKCGGEGCCKCRKCIGGAVTYIAKMTWKQTDKWCADDKNNMGMKHDKKKHYFCMFWHAHPKVAFGFVMHHVRPMQSGTAWCMGHGDCKKHEETDMLNPFLMSSGLEDDKTAMPAPMSLTFSDEEMMHAFDVYDEPKDIEQEYQSFFEDIDRMHMFQDFGEMQKGDEKGGHVCVECYKKVFKIVMKIAVMKTVGMCKSTKCPFLQGWCKWAATHKAVALGMIMGEAEPWKYAIGRCWKPDGKGKGKGRGKWKAWMKEMKGKGKGKEGMWEQLIAMKKRHHDSGVWERDGEQPFLAPPPRAPMSERVMGFIHALVGGKHDHEGDHDHSSSDEEPLIVA